MGVGDEIWERFGHDGLRVVNATAGTDTVYNWGTFDMSQPHFLQRFMTGNTQYWMQGDGMDETMARYHYLNRSVWLQELDLTPAERAAISDFIAWNARPENLYYRYDTTTTTAPPACGTFWTACSAANSKSGWPRA
jgi:hypothetical protein